MTKQNCILLKGWQSKSSIKEFCHILRRGPPPSPLPIITESGGIVINWSVGKSFGTKENFLSFPEQRQICSSNPCKECKMFLSSLNLAINTFAQTEIIQHPHCPSENEIVSLEAMHCVGHKPETKTELRIVLHCTPLYIPMNRMDLLKPKSIFNLGNSRYFSKLSLENTVCLCLAKRIHPVPSKYLIDWLSQIRKYSDCLIFSWGHWLVGRLSWITSNQQSRWLWWDLFVKSFWHLSVTLLVSRGIFGEDAAEGLSSFLQLWPF